MSSWSFDIEQFAFSFENTESLSLRDQVLACKVSLYGADGTELSSASATREEDGSLRVVCPSCKLEDSVNLEITFLDENQQIILTENYQVTTTAPTCTESGSVKVLSADGLSTIVLKIMPAEGHEYAQHVEKHILEQETWLRTCLNCSYEEVTSGYPDCSIARLRMYGDLTGIGKRTEVPITVYLESEEMIVDCYALLKYQGHSSLVFEKKNFTLKLFNDAGYFQKNKIVFRDWNKEHKYVLKANYTDASICRNLICADIWSEMVACRTGHHVRLDGCSNYGTTDGFPVALYLNDEFLGLYTFTLHRDDDLFDMEDGLMDGILVSNTNYTDAAYFKAPATFDEFGDWEVAFSGLEDDTQWLEAKLNTLIDFVMHASDEEFRADLHQYLDVNSAIDYLIAVYSLGLTNNVAKNITLATYDNGVLFCSLYDMDKAFGLSTTGDSTLPPTEYLPTCTNGEWDSATGNLLWDRLLQQFEPEIRQRYEELRQSVLTTENIMQKTEAFFAPISDIFYQMDAALYPDMPQLQVSTEEQIKEYITQRFQLLDAMFLHNTSK